jgi:hypothetical protein
LNLVARPFSGTSRFGRALRIALIAAILGAAVAFQLPLCPFAIVTRHPCPGCGLTRATLALLRGDLSGALHLHPLALLVPPVVIGGLLFNAFEYVRTGGWFATEAIRARTVTVIAAFLSAALLVVWIARFLGAFGGPVPV